jgi:hypothetical protein
MNLYQLTLAEKINGYVSFNHHPVVISLDGSSRSWTVAARNTDLVNTLVRAHCLAVPQFQGPLSLRNR